MLTWDDEVKPSSQNLRRRPQTRAAEPSPTAWRPRHCNAPLAPWHTCPLPPRRSAPRIVRCGQAHHQRPDRCQSAGAVQIQMGLGKYLATCANHWMPQEINMTRDIALWKDPNGLTEDERRIVKRNLGFSSPPTRWRPTTSCSAPTATSRRPSAASFLLRQAFEGHPHPRLPVHRRKPGPGRGRDLQRLQRVPVHPQQGRVPDPPSSTIMDPRASRPALLRTTRRC